MFPYVYIGYSVCRQRALARSHVLFVGAMLIIHIVNIHVRVFTERVVHTLM